MNCKYLKTSPLEVECKITNEKEERVFWRFNAQCEKIFFLRENANLENLLEEYSKLNAMFEILMLLEMISPEVTIASLEAIINGGDIFLKW